jgi:hypothetical protein
VSTPRAHVRPAGLALALALLVSAAALGAEPFHGTFGVTGQKVDCGSVWHLYSQDDLNAKSCTSDLRSRLTLTAVVTGLAISVADAALWPKRRKRLPWVLLPGVVVAVAMVVAGRHFIWRVSGA